MANSGLARMAKRHLNRLQADNTRDKVQGFRGQIFIWDREQFEKDMNAFTTPDIVKTLVESYRAKLKAKDSIMLSGTNRARLEAAKIAVRQYKLDGFNPAKHEIFAVASYYVAQEVKRLIGQEFNTLTGKDASLVTGATNKTGDHIGHGEFGHAVSTTKVLMGKAALETKGSQKVIADAKANPKTSGFVDRMYRNIHKYEEGLGVELTVEHTQHVTSRGQLRKTFTPILSSQKADQNLTDAVSEKKFLQQLIKDQTALYKEIVEQEGSRSLKDAIRDTTVYGLQEGKHKKKRKYKGKGKPVKEAKSKGKGTAKGKVKTAHQINTIKGAGTPKPPVRKKQARRTPTAGASLVSFQALLNDRLPDTVAKNMQDPRLNYQTGRFASSVRSTDVMITPQGFPSIGYTYMKYPYQTFEPGFAQGSPDRDPRRLIEMSIREIAAGVLVGRFYTRRV